MAENSKIEWTDTTAAVPCTVCGSVLPQGHKVTCSVACKKEQSVQWCARSVLR